MRPQAKALRSLLHAVSEFRDFGYSLDDVLDLARSAWDYSDTPGTRPHAIGHCIHCNKVIVAWSAYHCRSSSKNRAPTAAAQPGDPLPAPTLPAIIARTCRPITRRPVSPEPSGPVPDGFSFCIRFPQPSFRKPSPARKRPFQTIPGIIPNTVVTDRYTSPTHQSRHITDTPFLNPPRSLFLLHFPPYFRHTPCHPAAPHRPPRTDGLAAAAQRLRPQAVHPRPWVADDLKIRRGRKPTPKPGTIGHTSNPIPPRLRRPVFRHRRPGALGIRDRRPGPQLADPQRCPGHHLPRRLYARNPRGQARRRPVRPPRLLPAGVRRPGPTVRRRPRLRRDHDQEIPSIPPPATPLTGFAAIPTPWPSSANGCPTSCPCPCAAPRRSQLRPVLPLRQLAHKPQWARIIHDEGQRSPTWLAHVRRRNIAEYAETPSPMSNAGQSQHPAPSTSSAIGARPSSPRIQSRRVLQRWHPGEPDTTPPPALIPL